MSSKPSLWRESVRGHINGCRTTSPPQNRLHVMSDATPFRTVSSLHERNGGDTMQVQAAAALTPPVRLGELSFGLENPTERVVSQEVSDYVEEKRESPDLRDPVTGLESGRPFSAGAPRHRAQSAGSSSSCKRPRSLLSRDNRSAT
jgi:hypothetical protein